MTNLRNPKCQCGKTKNPNGNCDGSHANPKRSINTLLKVLVVCFSIVAIQSFVPKENAEVVESSIEWKGEKVLGSHNGILSLKSSEITFKDEVLVGGKFVMDMTSISCTDLTGDSKSSLENHLKSADFFSVSKFPTSELIIKKATKLTNNSYDISAMLTIKNITKDIRFVANMQGNSLNANIIIDRTEFDVRYGSGSFFDDLGDNMIMDDFEITVNLEL